MEYALLWLISSTQFYKKWNIYYTKQFSALRIRVGCRNERRPFDWVAFKYKYLERFHIGHHQMDKSTVVTFLKEDIM